MKRTLKRLALFLSVFLALSAVGTYVVYAQVAGRSLSLDPALVSGRVLGLCALLLVAYFVTDGLRLHFTLVALGHRLPFGWLMRLVFINLFVSNVTPLATGGGVAQVLYLKSRNVPVGTATAATTIRTVLAVLFIFSSVPIFLATLSPGAVDASGPRIAGYLAASVTVYLGFFGIVLARPRWLAPPLVAGVQALHALRIIDEARAARWRFAVRRELLRFVASFRRYLTGPPVAVALSIVFTALFLLALFSFPAILLWGLGYDIPYLSVVGLLVLTTFVMYFSPTPGASGIAEGTFGFLFAGRVGPEHLVQMTLAWRFLTIYLGMAIGLAILQRELMHTLPPDE